MYSRFLTNPLVDTGNPMADTWNNTGLELQGCLQQLYLLKQRNPAFKVLLSIGGWGYSTHFALPASTDSSRSNFAASVVSLVQNLGLDGVDIDWEYPANAAQGQDFVYLVQAVRNGLNTIGDPEHPFLLSVAGPGPFGYEFMQLTDMDCFVDFWNLMAYDYVGAWSNFTGDLANLKASSTNPVTTPFNTQKILEFYASQNISSAKIVLGMPLYGRYFNNTAGLGQPFVGSGTYDVRDLPLTGASVVYDNSTGSSYSYDANKEQVVSYDNNLVGEQKATWIISNGLGGAMFWECSQDSSDQSMIQTVANVLGTNSNSLDNLPNHLSYPNSTYDNLARGMPESSSASVTMLPTSDATGSAITSMSSAATCMRDTCATYTARDCSGNACSCALDTEGNADCVLHRRCDAIFCSTTSDCNTGAVCIVNNCCSDGKGRCVLTTDTADCLSGPPCKRYNNGGIYGVGGTTGPGLFC